MKKTLVIGASENPSRYSHLAILRLREKEYPVFAIGKKRGKIADVDIVTGKTEVENLHTITIYLNPVNQKEYFDYIIQLKPERVIFNPGAENPELVTFLNQNNIKYMDACTLVMLATGEF
ncbi:MAG: CoA-binding protein [Bacteroidia bacterium]